MRDASCEEGRTTWGRDRSREVFGKTFFLAKHELIQLSHLFVGRHVYYARAALAALEKEYAQGETGVVGTYLSSNDSDGISEEVFEGRCREARREARAEE